MTPTADGQAARHGPHRAAAPRALALPVGSRTLFGSTDATAFCSRPSFTPADGRSACRERSADTIAEHANPAGSHTTRLIDACWRLGPDPTTHRPTAPACCAAPPAHDARRTCASLLVDLDVHPRVAMAVLRHADSITMEIYSQASSAATREALRRLGEP